MSKRIAITLGDPGGIGPDICVMMAQSHINRNHIVITDPKLLSDSSKKLMILIYPLSLRKYMEYLLHLVNNQALS